MARDLDRWTRISIRATGRTAQALVALRCHYHDSKAPVSMSLQARRCGTSGCAGGMTFNPVKGGDGHLGAKLLRERSPPRPRQRVIRLLGAAQNLTLRSSVRTFA